LAALIIGDKKDGAAEDAAPQEQPKQVTMRCPRCRKLRMVEPYEGECPVCREEMLAKNNSGELTEAQKEEIKLQSVDESEELVATDAKQVLHYVRKPNEKQVFTAKLSDIELTADIADWLEGDLLKMATWKIKELEMDNYRLHQTLNGITMEEDPDGTLLARYEDYKWSIDGEVPEGKEIDEERLNEVKNALSAIQLEDVRRKPVKMQELASGQLRGVALTQALRALQQVGFVVAKNGDNLMLASKNGELTVRSSDGVVYVLLFGEIADVESQESQEQTADGEAQDEELAATRHLWVTVQFDEQLLGPMPQPPAKPTEGTGEEAEKIEEEYQKNVQEYETELKKWNDTKKEGQERYEELRKRFDNWLYVISADVYDQISFDRKDILKDVEVEEEETEAVDDAEAGDAPAAGDETDVTPVMETEPVEAETTADEPEAEESVEGSAETENPPAAPADE
jgi:hypothetical protein